MAKFTLGPNFAAAMMALGGGLGDMSRQNDLKGMLADFNGDHNAAAQALMRMGRIDDAVKIYSAGALGDYRSGQLAVAQTRAANDRPSVDEQIYDDFKAGKFTQPSYLGGPDEADAAEAAEAAGTAPTGVPGINTVGGKGLPRMIAEKILPVDEYERLKAGGQNAADVAEHGRKKDIASTNADAVMRGLLGDFNTFDDASIQNSLGPTQGNEVDMSKGWTANIGPGLAQTAGTAMNWLEGGKFATQEVRDAISTRVNALTNSIKSFVKVKGDVWSDKDQALLTSITGNLQNANSREEFNRRYNRSVDAINDAFGLNLTTKAPEAEGGQSEYNEEGASWSEEPSSGVPVRKVATETTGPAFQDPATMTPGAEPKRTTKAPPIPSTSKRNKFIQWMRVHPDDRAAAAYWDSQYGEGNADFLLNGAR
jgi:hypothetical protein